MAVAVFTSPGLSTIHWMTMRRTATESFSAARASERRDLRWPAMLALHRPVTPMACSPVSSRLRAAARRYEFAAAGL